MGREFSAVSAGKRRWGILSNDVLLLIYSLIEFILKMQQSLKVSPESGGILLITASRNPVNIYANMYRSLQMEEGAYATGQIQQEDTSSGSSSDRVDITQIQDVRVLQQTEEKVIAHERAHMSAGGQFAGGVSYQYTQGPDGKRYISGGEVPISIRPGRNPAETVRNMQQVRRAALAPADPSPQDLSVASAASLIEMKAAHEISGSSTAGEGKLNILV